jgi:hypothetical protein
MFSEAMSAAAFRDSAAAQRGLMTVTEWKLIAEQDGIDWRVVPDPVESEALLAGPAGFRSLPEAKVENRSLAGRAPTNGATPGTDTIETKNVPAESATPPEANGENTDDVTAAP